MRRFAEQIDGQPDREIQRGVSQKRVLGSLENQRKVVRYLNDRSTDAFLLGSFHKLRYVGKKMPALKLFGRKWLAATDDLVYPGIFELLIRFTWLILIGIGCLKYYESTWQCRAGGDFVRVYLLGIVVILGTVMVLTCLIIRYSSKGSVSDTHARRYVEPLLTIKILMIIPEINWNILGTLWIFGGNVDCKMEEYTINVVEALIFFDWILIGLTILGLALVFDPLGSLGLREQNLDIAIEYGKFSRIWRRRFKFLWWMRKDESAKETFQHVAGET